MTPVYVDNSILRAVAECSTKAALRHVLDLGTPEERAELQCGRAMHEALATVAAGQPHDVALNTYDGAYMTWAVENVRADHRLSHHNTRAVLMEWLRRSPLQRWPLAVVPSMVEVGFDVPLVPAASNRPALHLTGRLDALGRDAQGDWWVIEHKTTGRLTRFWRERFRLDSQLSGYVHAARVTTGQRVVGVMVNAIELDLVPSSERKCKDHAVQYAECGPLHVNLEWFPITRTDEQLQLWLATAQRLAARYLVLRERVASPDDLGPVPMEGTFNYGCAWCNFKDFCMAGRRPDTVATMLVPDPWRPFTPPLP